MWIHKRSFSALWLDLSLFSLLKKTKYAQISSCRRCRCCRRCRRCRRCPLSFNFLWNENCHRRFFHPPQQRRWDGETNKIRRGTKILLWLQTEKHVLCKIWQLFWICETPDSGDLRPLQSELWSETTSKLEARPRMFSPRTWRTPLVSLRGFHGGRVFGILFLSRVLNLFF